MINVKQVMFWTQCKYYVINTMVVVALITILQLLWYCTWCPPPQNVSAVHGFGVWQIGIRALFIVNWVYQPIKDIQTINTAGLKYSDQEFILLNTKIFN